MLCGSMASPLSQAPPPPPSGQDLHHPRLQEPLQVRHRPPFPSHQFYPAELHDNQCDCGADGQGDAGLVSRYMYLTYTLPEYQQYQMLHPNLIQATPRHPPRHQPAAPPPTPWRKRSGRCCRTPPGSPALYTRYPSIPCLLDQQLSSFNSTFVFLLEHS